MSNSSKKFQGLVPQIAGDVLVDALSRGIYATDASNYQIHPLGVVFPKTKSDLVATIRFCLENGIALLPRGGGTSLAGQTVGECLIVDFSKYLDRILEINPTERWALVQPGVIRDSLNKETKLYNLHFAPDPATSSRAAIGGMIANNSSGTKSILYGKTSDHLISLRVLLMDGTELVMENLNEKEWQRKCELNNREGEIYKCLDEIISDKKDEIAKRYPKTLRRVGGFALDAFLNKDTRNLAHLICGSEGTLGIILEAKVKLEPLPKHSAICLLHFNDFFEAVETVAEVLECHPAAVEIIDRHVLELARENKITAPMMHVVKGEPAAVLICEFFDEQRASLSEKVERLSGQILRGKRAYAAPIYNDEKSQTEIWNIRKNGLGLVMGMKGKKKPLAFIEDAAIPQEHLSSYLSKVLGHCKELGVDAAAYAHASVGVVHVRPILDLRDVNDIENMKGISQKAYEWTREYRGSWSSEHGDGLSRSAYLKDFYGDKIYAAFEEIKKTFDPKNLLNPGKIVNAPPIDRNLRYGKDYTEQKIDSQFQFKSEGSFSEAVHLCTGVGACRKLEGGTMCPSFRATRDEEHSTRGRANALRLAMSGKLNGTDLTSDRVNEALDLCLSCKACKSECPSNVDMAKLKSEVKQLRIDKFGMSRKDKLVLNSSSMAKRMSGSKAGLINTLIHSTPVRFLIEKYFGIDRNRKLPAYASESFSTWAQKNFINGKTGKQVILFADTYLNYYEPSIGIAASKLLRKLDFEVNIFDKGCCQRPLLSHGLLKEAKKISSDLISNLNFAIENNLDMVVCEPSCYSAFVDDLPDLIEDEKAISWMQNQVYTLEAFLEKEDQIKNLNSSFVSRNSQLKLHGHCHQKALEEMNPLRKVLNQLSGNKDGASLPDRQEIPSGCCGMAGMFGYEKNHAAISQKIGEETLFPAIDSMAQDEVLVANGFSCRHQIEHFTGKKAVHWVELIE